MSKPSNKKLRRIQGLQEACLYPGRPANIPKGKPRGKKARGLSYEAKVGEILQRWSARGELYGAVRCGQWFAYRDIRGAGFCQPDILIIQPTLVIIVESKYTQTESAFAQLNLLYRPVVQHCFKRPVRVVQVCHNLIGPPAHPVKCPTELGPDSPDLEYTWHFLAEFDGSKRAAGLPVRWPTKGDKLTLAELGLE